MSDTANQWGSAGPWRPERRRTMGSARAFRRWALSPIAVGLAALTMLAAVTAGVGVPSLGILALPGSTSPDYARALHGFAPLEPDYIKQVLGEAIVPHEPDRTASRPAGSVSESADDTPRIIESHPLTNDAFATARLVPGVPYTARTDTSVATAESGEPADCGPAPDHTVWYRYTPATDIGLIADTFGTDYATTLGVFTGGAGAFRMIGCDTDLRGNAIWAFPAKRHTTYFFQIAGPTGGNLVFNLSPQGVTTLESASPSGEPGEGISGLASLSADGRYLVFLSFSTNLVAGRDARLCVSRDPDQSNFNRLVNGAVYAAQPCLQVFVRDRRTGSTTIASVSSSGEQGNGHSLFPHISGDGRYVSFASDATNLVPGDDNHLSDIFVHDLRTRTTELVSVDSEGRPMRDGTQLSFATFPTLSHDGRSVAFATAASSLVPGDTNGAEDVFVHDRITGRTERVSVDSSGRQAESPQSSLDTVNPYVPTQPSITPDGRFVAFTSTAALVPEDTNEVADVYVHDRLTGRTERVSVGFSGEQGDQDAKTSYQPRGQTLSADGRFAVFVSASALDEDDRNGIEDVFVHDRLIRQTIRVSVSSSGQQAEPRPDSSQRSTKTLAGISTNGRYIAFNSPAALEAGDTNERTDVYVHDLWTGTTTRVSVTAAGETTDRDAGGPAISADGRVIAFDSFPLQGPYFGSMSVPGLVAQVYTHERPRRTH